MCATCHTVTFGASDYASISCFGCELISNVSPAQFKLVSNDVFDQFKTNGVMDPAVDVAFNPLHHGKAAQAPDCGTVGGHA
jgi:hypothetical protein